MKKNKLWLLLICLLVIINLDCRGYDNTKIYNDFTPTDYKTVKWSSVFPMLDRGLAISDGSRLITGSSFLFLKAQIKISNYLFLWANIAKNYVDPDKNFNTDVYDSDTRMKDARLFQRCVLALVEAVSKSNVSNNVNDKMTVETLNSLKREFNQKLNNYVGMGRLSYNFKMCYSYIMNHHEFLYMMLRCDYGYLMQIFNPPSNDDTKQLIAPPLDESNMKILSNGYYVTAGPFTYFMYDGYSDSCYAPTHHGGVPIPDLFTSKKTCQIDEKKEAEIGIFYPIVIINEMSAEPNGLLTRYSSNGGKWLPFNETSTKFADNIAYLGKASDNQPGNYFIINNMYITYNKSGHTGYCIGTTSAGLKFFLGGFSFGQSSPFTVLLLNITEDMLPEDTYLGRTFNSAGLNILYNYMITGTSDAKN